MSARAKRLLPGQQLTRGALCCRCWLRGRLIRDGSSVAALMDKARMMLGRRQVLPGVPELLRDVQVEGTFPDGTKLVTVHSPLEQDDGDLSLAL